MLVGLVQLLADFNLQRGQLIFEIDVCPVESFVLSKQRLEFPGFLFDLVSPAFGLSTLCQEFVL